MNPKVAQYALFAGLCAFVPVPLLDGWLERRATRAMLIALAEGRGQPLEPAVLDVLVEDRSSLLLGCLAVVVVWPIKKLFRTILYFLTIKDVIDGVALASLRAAMVDAAFHRLPGDVKGVRDVMDATLGRWQWSPVSRVFLRGERPEAEWLVPGPADLGVGHVFRHAGGGAVVADFQKRLEALP
jgi:hypothetical protein